MTGASPSGSPSSGVPELLRGQAGVERAAAILRSGGIVGIPTETVYGLACDAMNAEAIARVFEAKQRPSFDPLIVHVADLAAAEKVARFTPLAHKLAERFWPGPLTLVLPKDSSVPDLVTAGRSSVGVRVPNHELALALLREFGGPLAAPSANPFGYISPTSAAHVVAQLGDDVDAVLDGGVASVGIESTVVRLREDGTAEILRPGGLSFEEIAEVAGAELVTHGTPVHVEHAVKGELSPGRLRNHYAPGCPLILVPPLESLPDSGDEGEDAGLLAFKTPPHSWEQEFRAVEVLSPTGDLREAAANLFAAMRRLDAAGLRQIIAERAPDVGLGRAINDRLERASSRS